MGSWRLVEELDEELEEDELEEEEVEVEMVEELEEDYCHGGRRRKTIRNKTTHAIDPAATSQPRPESSVFRLARRDS